MTKGGPPRIARALLERPLPGDLRATVTVDLDEMYVRRVEREGALRARIWYRAQALSFLVRFGWQRLRERLERPRARERITSLDRGFYFSLLDWKLGFRMLVKYPGLSAISGIALAAAIGTGAGFVEVMTTTLRPKLPFEDGERIVRVENWDTQEMQVEPRALYDYALWREELVGVQELGAYRNSQRNLVGSDGAAGPVWVAEITASAFSVTRVQPLLGRALTEADERPGAADVLVLGYELWRTRYEGDPAVLGRAVQLGRSRKTVVGVMPEDFRFPINHQVWVPLRTSPTDPREGAAIHVVGRLADNASLRSAQAELTAVGERSARDHPATHARLQPRVLRYAEPGPEEGGLLAMLAIGVVTLVLLVVASANAATLIFARTALRESEVVIRSALGASRGRIVGQLFIEALVLALVSAGAGLGATALVFKVLTGALAWDLANAPFWWDADIEVTTILYAGGLAVLGAAFVSLLPAAKATVRVQPNLQRLASGGTSLGFGGAWSVIIVGQVAITVLCLPIAMAISHEAKQDAQMRLAFSAGQYLTFEVQLDEERISEGVDAPSEEELQARAASVLGELERRLAAEPGVRGVAFTEHLPGTGRPQRRVEVQQGGDARTTTTAESEGVLVGTTRVAPGFFEAFSIPPTSGRSFDARDLDGSTRAVIVNESLARRLGGNPVGVRLRYAASGNQPPGEWQEVVGVVPDLGTSEGDLGAPDDLFQPAGPAELSRVFVALRLASSPAEFQGLLARIALNVDPGLRLYDVAPLEEVNRRYEFSALLATLSAAGVMLLTVLLSAAGLFALMSVGVARRTREIGIRRALGASTGSVLTALFARAAKQVGLGIVIGNALVAIVFVKVASGGWGDVWQPIAAVSALMALVGLLACGVPARRALRILPTEAIRE
jgi:predicted permease